jgi:hypothetical protein
MEATQEQQLDMALARLQSLMIDWGLDNCWLGYRTPTTLRLSVDGAINLYDLVNTLTGEIDRLEKVAEYLGQIIDYNKEQYLISEAKAGN